MNSHLAQRLLWGFLIVGMIAIGGLSLANWLKPHHEKLDNFGAVPEFLLKDQSNRDVTLASFKGHVWVADLIFTHCTSICPMLTAKMFALQQELKDQPDVRLVSFSVDPTHDGPDTLALYASAHHADMRRWSFLTGPVPTIYSVAKDGFHLPLDSTGGDQTTPIIHSPRFVLIDTKGSVRAYYDGSQDESRKKILSDIEALREEVAR